VFACVFVIDFKTATHQWVIYSIL